MHPKPMEKNEQVIKWKTSFIYLTKVDVFFSHSTFFISNFEFARLLFANVTKHWNLEPVFASSFKFHFNSENENNNNRLTFPIKLNDWEFPAEGKMILRFLCSLSLNFEFCANKLKTDAKLPSFIRILKYSTLFVKWSDQLSFQPLQPPANLAEQNQTKLVKTTK